MFELEGQTQATEAKEAPKVSEQVMGEAFQLEVQKAIAEKGVGKKCKACGLTNEAGRTTCRACKASLYGDKSKKVKGARSTRTESGLTKKEQKALARKEKAKAKEAKKAEKAKGKKKAPKKEKAPRSLKYGFDKLEKGASMTIPNAEAKAGKVTIYENVRILAYEYGKRNGAEFEIEKKGSGVKVTRTK